MHRRLRRQVDEALGEGESSPPLRKLLRRIEKEYLRADEDRVSLERALGLLSDLLRRQPEGGHRRKSSARSRAVLRLFEQAPFAALLCDADRKVTAWNAAAERLFGIPAAEAVGRELSMLVFPDSDSDRAQARTDLRELLESAETLQSLRPTPTRSGAPLLCEWTVVPLRDRKGQEVGNAAVVQAADPVRDRYALAWQGAGDGIWDWDLATDRLWVSDSWRAIVGAGSGGDAPSEWLERVHPNDREALQAAIRAHLDGASPRFESEHRLRHEDGSWRWVLARGQANRDPTGKALRFSGSAMDVTVPKVTATRALHDALTELPNRTHFLELVKGSLVHARRRQDYRTAVLLVDVDRFKSVNEGLGHSAGDELLLEMRERLRGCLREDDVLARTGADEFGILLDDLEEGDAERIVRHIQDAVARPFGLSGHQVFATTSIGIAPIGAAYSRAEDLLLDADAALYRAKAQGGARSAAFDPGLRERAPQLVELEADLRNALARDEFRVHYLPIVDVATGRIRGLEALIRWAHPRLGLVPPEQFVPLAEETGLIVPIGRWLLAEAGREFQDCRAAGAAEPLTLNVNLSSRQLHHPALLDHLDGVLAQHRLDPRELVVEVTEKTLQQGDGSAARLDELRDRGVRLYMDDFGTGSSSLSSLFRYQLDSLKIDRSLFSGGSPRGQAPDLVRTIVAAARETGTHVVAEGVETKDQFGFLREVGCGGAQGFYFSPPVDGVAARSLLDRSASW